MSAIYRNVIGKYIGENKTVNSSLQFLAPDFSIDLFLSNISLLLLLEIRIITSFN